MKQRQLTILEAVKIGLLFSAGIGLLLLIVWPASLYTTIFATNGIIVVFVFGIIGALLGKFLLQRTMGSLFGSAIAIALLCYWLYSIASNTLLD